MFSTSIHVLNYTCKSSVLEIHCHCFTERIYISGYTEGPSGYGKFGIVVKFRYHLLLQDFTYIHHHRT
jgi:hypothetical protein